MTVNPITSSRVQSAIALASSKTGVDFDYLLGQAKIESGLNANARAGTSSASGLYQFVEQSWLAVVKKHGAEHASDNKDVLEGTLGRSTNGTDLYMAHFLGLGGAKKFLSAMQSNPGASAASLFPQAAGANRSIFYAGNGQPRSLEAIYQRFADKLGAASDSTTETRKANLAFAAQSLDMDGSTVVTGGNESAEDALAWASQAMGRMGGRLNTNPASANALLRPSPQNARLAYMMLASMGGR